MARQPPGGWLPRIDSEISPRRNRAYSPTARFMECVAFRTHPFQAQVSSVEQPWAEHALRDIPLQISVTTLAVYSGRNSPKSGTFQAYDARQSNGAESALLSANINSASTIARNYSTSFILDENPISEQMSWINGKAVGLDWADVRTMRGLAFGVSLPSKYADPTAVL